MYFTCEIHNKQFATIQALKDHVAHCHSDDTNDTKNPSKGKETKFSKTKKAQNIQILPKSETSSPRKKSINHRRIVYTQSDNITSNVPDIQPISTMPIQCHICNVLCSSSEDVNIHLKSHFTDKLLTASINTSKEIKTETDVDAIDIVYHDIKVDTDLFPQDEQIEMENSASSTQFPQCAVTPPLKGRNIKRPTMVKNPNRFFHLNLKHKNDYVEYLPIGKIVCYFCGYSPTVLQHFDIHTRKHTLERPYRCKICSRVCRTQEIVEEHEKTHTYKSDKGRRFKCVECGSRFKCASTLRKHKFTHSSNRPFSCSLCSSSHKRLSDLKRHVQSIHEKLKPYKCDICVERVFARRDFYKLHMRTNHPGVEYKEPVPQFNKSSQAARRFLFTCDSCKINFTVYDEFLSHQNKFHATIEPRKTHCRIKRTKHVRKLNN